MIVKDVYCQKQLCYVPMLCAHPFVNNEYLSLKVGRSDFGVHRYNLKLGWTLAGSCDHTARQSQVVYKQLGNLI